MSLQDLLPNADQFQKLINSINIQSNTKAPDDFAGAPGTKNLVAGTKDIGFYGFVKPTEFGQITVGENQRTFDGGNLAAAIGLTTGTILFNDVQWLKTSYRGKVQYIAMRPLRYGVSWDDLYRVGAVYGTNNNGYLPPQGRRGPQLNINAGDNSLNTTPLDNFMFTDPDNPQSTQGHVAQVGDIITIAGFNNESNNGNYTVASITTNKIILTVPAGKTLVTEQGSFATTVYKQANLRNQNAQVTIGGMRYKVRLIGGSRSEPRLQNTPNMNTFQSEWNDLILPLSIKAQTKNWRYAQFAENIPDFGVGLTDIDLQTDIRQVGQQGAYTICANSSANSSYLRILRGFNSVEFATDNRSWWNSFVLGWRPVLELVENNRHGTTSLV